MKLISSVLSEITFKTDDRGVTRMDDGTKTRTCRTQIVSCPKRLLVIALIQRPRESTTPSYYESPVFLVVQRREMCCPGIDCQVDDR